MDSIVLKYKKYPFKEEDLTLNNIIEKDPSEGTPFYEFKLANERIFPESLSKFFTEADRTRLLKVKNRDIVNEFPLGENIFLYETITFLICLLRNRERIFPSGSSEFMYDALLFAPILDFPLCSTQDVLNS